MGAKPASKGISVPRGLGWMRPLCDPDRSDLARPLQVTVDGQRWAIATNGHALVAVPAHGQLPYPSPHRVGRMRAVLASSRVGGQQTDLEAFLRFCARAGHEHRGTYPVWPRRIYGVPFNAFLIRRYVDRFRFSQRIVVVSPAPTPTQPMVIAGTDWRVAVMGLLDIGYENSPRWPKEV